MAQGDFAASFAIGEEQVINLYNGEETSLMYYAHACDPLVSEYALKCASSTSQLFYQTLKARDSGAL